MNIDELKNIMSNNYVVLANKPELKGKILHISQVSYCFSMGRRLIRLSVRDQCGKEYEVDPSLISYIPIQISNTVSDNIRKEIAFLLIQNGHVVDKGFKGTVDNVVDAITL